MNALRSQLDRRLAQRGEMVYLRRYAGLLQTYVECRIPALIRSLAVEQLIGGLSQQWLFLIVSPTHILRAQWPGGVPQTIAAITGQTDPRIPRINDKIAVRGPVKNIEKVAPVFDRGECIRIEINVIG